MIGCKLTDNVTPFLGKLNVRLGSWTENASLEVAKKIQTIIKKRTPVVSGRLRGSISVEKLSAYSSDVYTCCKYSRPVEFGHKAFTVYPVNARCLHWDDVFAMSASIPATRGQHFFFGEEEGETGRSALESLWEEIQKL